MRITCFFSLVIASLSVSAQTDKINYKLIVESKSERMGQYVIRYFNTLKSPCMGYLQSLISDKGNNWSIYQSKALCELDGKSTRTDYAYAGIKDLYFEDDSIRIIINSFPLVSGGEYLSHCTIKVNKGKFSPMACDKPKPVSS